MDRTLTVQVIANMILYALWVAFFESMLERRWRRWITLCVWAAVNPLWVFASRAFAYGSFMRFIIGPIILFAASMTLYKSRWLRCLFSVGSVTAIMVLCEVAAVFCFPQTAQLADNWTKMDQLKVVGFGCFYLPMNAGLLFATAAFSRQYQESFTGRDWLLFAPFPVSQMCIVFSWFQLLIGGVTRKAVLLEIGAILLCLGADTALFFSMRSISQRAVLRAENALLAKQIDAQKEHYAALTDQYESIRHMRHDIENHLHTIHILLENGQMAEASAYAAELQTGPYRSRLGQYQNPVVDAFLFYRLGELRAQGIMAEARVELPVQSRIANADLISAFGNLLDNAAAACSEAAEKRITVNTSHRNGYLLIQTENPAATSAPARERRIPDLPRGVGFHILRELGEKYQGAFATEVSDGVFHAALTLREEETNAADSDL